MVGVILGSIVGVGDRVGVALGITVGVGEILWFGKIFDA